VTRPHNCVTRESEDFFPDTPNQKFTVAAGQIPSPNASAKKHISADQSAVLREVKAQAPRTMPRHIENIRGESKQVLPAALAQQTIGYKGFDLQGKSESLEKIPLAHHGHRIRMAQHRAAMAALDRSRISRVIPMTMGQNQKVDLLAGKVFIGPFRSVEKDVPTRRLDEKAVSLIGASGESFELKHSCSVEATCLILLAQPVRDGDL
jgi:hypothetical protein